MEIRRFGVGHRRPDGPGGTTGVAGQVIHADACGSIVELAFARGASMEPFTSPHAAWFIVIEGGGWVRVGDETARVAAGEAVLWPAGLDHCAWSELSEMRAMIVEMAGLDDPTRHPADGLAGRLDSGDAPPGEGSGACPPAQEEARGMLSRAGGEAGGAAAAEGEPL